MKKQPYLPLYTGDWKKDPKLSRCAPATRGIWIDLLCDMHELDRCGELRGTTEELAVAARTTPEQVVQALTDLQAKDAAVVESRNGMWLVRNRRMHAESRKRKLAAERQLRHRKGGSNAESHAPPAFEGDIEIDSAFERFWEVYPKGRKGSRKPTLEAFAKAAAKVDVETIIAAASEYALSEIATSPWVKMATTWLNQECWSDDPTSWIDTKKERAWHPISADNFRELVHRKKFSEGFPQRDKTNPNRVYGKLRDGRQVECGDYPLPQPSTVPKAPTLQSEAHNA